jgi:choline-sulfatase
VAALGAVAGLAAWLVLRGPHHRDTAPAAAAKSFAHLLGDLSPARLNVILITVDTLRADRLSCYGSTTVATPNMDALAREGIRFTAAASTIPFTLPSHSSIMTGTYPARHGVRENVGYVLDDGLPTLAERLAAGGWTTAGFVSAFVLDSRWGISRGFGTYFDHFDPGATHEVNLGVVQRDGRDTVAEAVRWLDGEPQRPIFLWLHLFDPHDPYTPREPFKSRYPRSPYDGEVAYADSLVGEFRRALDAKGLLDSSLLVLTGDHGEGLGQHREGFHGFFLYDSTIHIPLIVRLPGALLAGREVTTAVSHVDILPTILEATGQPVPESAQGSSLLPLILGLREVGDRHASLSESLYPLLHYGWAPLRSLRTGRYKFIEAPEPELYDLAEDPREQHNLVREDRRTAREMRDRLDALRHRVEQGAPAAGQRAELDQATLDRLQALGYVAGRGGVEAEEEGTEPRADPKDRIELHQLVMAAQADVGAGDLDRAQARLERALEVDPSILEAHQMLGTIAMQREQYDEAVAQFQAALAIDSELQSAIAGMARSYQELGRLEEARVGYERLASVDPENLQALMGLADIDVAQGQDDQAIAELEKASRWEKPPALALNRLGELLVGRGRKQEAEEQFHKAVERNPELGRGYFNLAVLEEDRGDLEAAIGDYEKAIAASPTDFEAQFNLGRLVGERGDAKRQQSLYEAALASNPDFVRGYYYLAKLLMDTGGNLERAEELARAGIAKDPEGKIGPLGYFVLADILNRQGQPAAAARAAAAGRRLQEAAQAAAGG